MGRKVFLGNFDTTHLQLRPRRATLKVARLAVPFCTPAIFGRGKCGGCVLGRFEIGKCRVACKWTCGFSRGNGQASVFENLQASEMPQCRSSRAERRLAGELERAGLVRNERWDRQGCGANSEMGHRTGTELVRRLVLTGLLSCSMRGFADSSPFCLRPNCDVLQSSLLP